MVLCPVFLEVSWDSARVASGDCLTCWAAEAWCARGSCGVVTLPLGGGVAGLHVSFANQLNKKEGEPQDLL